MVQRPRAARFALPKRGASDYPKGMIGGGAMRNGLLSLAGAGLLAGCSIEVPGLPRPRGGGDGCYSLRGAAAARAAAGAAARGRGRAGAARGDRPGRGEAPSQGYYTAACARSAAVRRTPRHLWFELVAVRRPIARRPARRARAALSAAVFMPEPGAEELRGFRVAGGSAVQTLSLPPRPGAAAGRPLTGKRSSPPQ